MTPDDISKSFCIMPWSGIATDPAGGYQPCCWMDKKYKFFGNLKDFKNSDYLNDIKKDFLKGKYPEACHRCEWNDKEGLTSKRTRENNNWLADHQLEDYENSPYTVIDVRLSNKCNLLCVSCNPKSSSAIYDELENNVNHVEHYQVVKKQYHIPTTPYSDSEVDELIKCISPYSRVYFTGGEPTLVKGAFHILEKLIENGYNKTVTVEFNSNFQAWNKKWINLLKNFKGVVMPSLDAVGKQAELIRYGCKWEDINRNFLEFVNQCDTYAINIAPTVSTLNIFYLKDIEEWASSFKSDRITVWYHNRLVSPQVLNIQHMPDQLKEKAVKYLGNDNKFKDILVHLNRDANPRYQKQFVETMNRLDEIRNTNWRETLNEIAYGWE